ncbi:DNA-binding transcriptional regulator, LysR family [Paraburkholderia fungorum]|uniref:DNA-binding transcriptional regulator, LysR family n=1 Tax=Paraburkholderia fungorum TaxID=134537 RepID=A0A1H1I462_9BURK|nr:LysR family transcriptional regulator [Paraburkholderia fungorum]SDR32497.1 DNA-binding transcriptional regulator, LysR family [Paraburkholderia fungorum]
MLGNLSDIDLKSLRVFCTIVEAGGFTAAQTILNTGLPRLSIMVRDLEVRLGTKLCHRGRQGFQVTEEGLAVYEAARVLFSDVSRFLDSVGALSGQPTARLALGVVDGLLSYPGSPTVAALQRFRKRLESTHLTLHVMPPDGLEKAVLDEKIALAIGAFHHRLSGLVYTPVFSEEQHLYCAKSHPLSTASGVGLMEAIAEAPYVERGYMLESNKPRHVAFNRVGTAFSMEAILTMLLTGTYIGYLPCHYAQRWVDERELFSLAPSAFSYSSLFSVITRQGKQLDATTSLMVESMSARPDE